MDATNARAAGEGIISDHSPEPVLNVSLRPTKHIFIPIHKYLFRQRIKRSQYTIISNDFVQKFYFNFLKHPHQFYGLFLMQVVKKNVHIWTSRERGAFCVPRRMQTLDQ